MYKSKKIWSVLLCLCLAVSFLCWTPGYAEEIAIIADETVEGRLVTIEGCVVGVSKSESVMLLVGDINNILYIDEVKSDHKGNFKFEFVLPQYLPVGEYEYRVGCNASIGDTTGYLYYQGETYEQSKKIADTVMDITIEDYVPTIEGTLYCGNGCSIYLSIENLTDGTTVARETVTPENGNFCNVSYTLPSLLSPKEYVLSVIYREGSETLLDAAIDISSYVLLVSAGGEIIVGDGVTAYAHLKSTDSDVIDKYATITDTQGISGTVPNMVANMKFHFQMNAYKAQSTSEETVQCQVFGEANDIVKVVATGKYMKSFANKTFTVKYDPTQLEAVNLWGLYSDMAVGLGRRGDVEILTYTPGTIVFRLPEKTIPKGKVWSSVLNIFNFKLLGNHADGAVVTISSQEV